MLTVRRREHLEMSTLASALCLSAPWFPCHLKGVSGRATATKSLMACRGRQELSYWRWARTLFSGHCTVSFLEGSRS